MATTPTLSALLAEARAAKHRLLTGAAVAEARDQNGEAVVYAKIDLPRLEAYILDLAAQVAREAGQCASPSFPLRVYF